MTSREEGEQADAGYAGPAARPVLPWLLGNLSKSISSGLTSPLDLQCAEQVQVSTNSTAFIGPLDPQLMLWVTRLSEVRGDTKAPRGAAEPFGQHISTVLA